MGTSDRPQTADRVASTDASTDASSQDAETPTDPTPTNPTPTDPTETATTETATTSGDGATAAPSAPETTTPSETSATEQTSTEQTSTEQTSTAAPSAAPPVDPEPEEDAADPMEGHSVWVSDIISRPPSWIQRRGNTVFLFILIAAVTMSWFVRYPDVVRAPVIFTTREAPVRVAASASRPIDRIFVEEKETVQAGTPLMLLDNAGVYEHVQQLEQWHEQVTGAIRTEAALDELPPIPEGLQVGIAQDAYMSLVQRLSDYTTFVNDPARIEKRQSLSSRLQQQSSLVETHDNQRALLQERFELRKSAHERNLSLFEKNMVSEEVVEESKSRMLDVQYQLRDLETTLVNNRIQMTRTETELLDLNQQWQNRERTLRLQMLDAYERLDNRLEEWQQNYLLTAPANGTVTFFDTMQPGQFVQASETVLAVVPETNEVEANLLLQPSDIGEIRAGQDVMIALQNPSSDRVGKIPGVVGDISLVSGQETFRVRVKLPNGLTTEFGHEIAFRQEMPGAAEIVTKKQRMLLRVFNWLRVLLSSNV